MDFYEKAVAGPMGYAGPLACGNGTWPKRWPTARTQPADYCSLITGYTTLSLHSFQIRLV